MYISKFQVDNYKGYLSSPDLNFTPGFNLVTGQNNAGKTALLEAIALQFTAKSHRSLQTVPNPSSQPNPTSFVVVSFSLSREELQDILLVPHTSFFLPSPVPSTDFALSIDYNQHDSAAATNMEKWFFDEPQLEFTLRLENTPNGERWTVPKKPSFADYAVTSLSDSGIMSRWDVNSDKSLKFGGFVGLSNAEDVGIRVAQQLRSRIYLFRAERFNAGSSAFGRESSLASNASNLAEVLNALQSNRDRFLLFNSLVGEILPQIQWVSVRPHPASAHLLEIVVWNHDPKTQRDDLAIPLSEGGTGIGQVLSILYVVLTSGYPRTIIIDEPQSFLHRGATRKLMEVLKRYSQHQFIISTHSPTVITATNPQTMTLIRQQDGQSLIEILDATEIAQQRRYLAEVGATPADVFGADNILWVEGDTEQECFPLILDQVTKRPLMGTIIRGIKHTGDLEGKHAELVFEIYDRLSQGRSLLPPALAFILDDEGRTPQQKAVILRRSHDRAHFIPRRMYENYLLVPAAIKAITASIEGFSQRSIPVEEIETLLTAKLGEARYYRARVVPDDEQKIKLADGANILRDIFSELSETRCAFDKVRHSSALTKWIIENSPDELQELSEFLNRVFETETSRVS